MQTRDIPLTSFAEGETTNLPLRFRATIVPQESSGEKIVQLLPECVVVVIVKFLVHLL